MSCVLTLALADDAQERFESLRQRWFPPERNQIPAHLTLFHDLPESEKTESVLRAVAEMTASFTMKVSEVRSLGRGVAYFLDSREAKALARHLQSAFLDVLNAQDRQGFRPHVVVQNKVEPAEAKTLLAILQAQFLPRTVNALGLDWWEYQGGPWRHIKRFAFAAAQGEAEQVS